MNIADAVDVGRTVTGRFVLNVWRDGRLIDRIDEDNLVVVGARQTLARLLGGDVADRSVTRIAFGTNTAAPVVGNTAITNPFSKLLDGVSYPAADKVQFDFSLGTTESNGVAIAEFGLLTAGNVLYARKNRAVPLNKENDLSFTGSWTITFA